MILLGLKRRPFTNSSAESSKEVTLCGPLKPTLLTAEAFHFAWAHHLRLPIDSLMSGAVHGLFVFCVTFVCNWFPENPNPPFSYMDILTTQKPKFLLMKNIIVNEKLEIHKKWGGIELDLWRGSKTGRM